MYNTYRKCVVLNDILLELYTLSNVQFHQGFTNPNPNPNTNPSITRNPYPNYYPKCVVLNDVLLELDTWSTI